MADKKRNKKKNVYSTEATGRKPPETFDDILDIVKEQTFKSITENEIFPRGRNTEDDDDTQIYYSHSSKIRYEQDPGTVAQHMQDRTQFRH